MPGALIEKTMADAIALRGAQVGELALRRRILAASTLVALCLALAFFGGFSGAANFTILLYLVIVASALPTLRLAAAIRKQQYARAQSLMRTAMTTNIRFFPFTSWVFGVGIDSQVRLWLRQAKFIEAETIARLTAAALERRAESNGCPQNAGLANSIGLSYLGQRRYTEAAEIFSQTLSRTKNARNKKLRLVMTNNIAYSRFMEGKLEESCRLFNEVLAETAGRKGKFERLVSTYVKCSLARVYVKTGAIEQADTLAEEALMLRQADKRQGDELAISYVAIAEVRAAQDRFEEAELSYLNALNLFRSTIASDHPLIVETLKGYAQVLKKAGKIEEAHKIVDEAIACSASLKERQQSAVEYLSESISRSLPLVQMLDRAHVPNKPADIRIRWP